MKKTKESREFTRLSIPVNIEVSADGIDPFTVTALNISMSGVLLSPDKKLPMETQCEVHILLGEQDPLIIVCRGKVFRSDENGVAIGFTEMDMSGFEHMKNLLLYNAPDADQLDDEFSSHKGLRPK